MADNVLYYGDNLDILRRYGKGIDMPLLGQVSVTFKKAPKAKATAETVPLPFGQ